MPTSITASLTAPPEEHRNIVFLLSIIIIKNLQNRFRFFEGFFIIKAEDAGGLAPGMEDNADRQKTNRKEWMILIRGF